MVVRSMRGLEDGFGLGVVFEAEGLEVRPVDGALCLVRVHEDIERSLCLLEEGVGGDDERFELVALFLVFALGEDDAVNGGLGDRPVGAFALVSLMVPTGRESERVLHAGVVY